MDDNASGTPVRIVAACFCWQSVDIDGSMSSVTLPSYRQSLLLSIRDHSELARLVQALPLVFIRDSSAPACGSGINFHSQCAAGSHRARESGSGTNVQDRVFSRRAELVAVGRNSTYCRCNAGREHVRVFFVEFMFSCGSEASSFIESHHGRFLHPLFFHRARKSSFWVF